MHNAHLLRSAYCSNFECFVCTHLSLTAVHSRPIGYLRPYTSYVAQSSSSSILLLCRACAPCSMQLAQSPAFLIIIHNIYLPNFYERALEKTCSSRYADRRGEWIACSCHCQTLERHDWIQRASNNNRASIDTHISFHNGWKEAGHCTMYAMCMQYTHHHYRIPCYSRSQSINQFDHGFNHSIKLQFHIIICSGYLHHLVVNDVLAHGQPCTMHNNRLHCVEWFGRKIWRKKIKLLNTWEHLCSKPWDILGWSGKMCNVCTVHSVGSIKTPEQWIICYQFSSHTSLKLYDDLKTAFRTETQLKNWNCAMQLSTPLIHIFIIYFCKMILPQPFGVQSWEQLSVHMAADATLPHTIQ